MDRKEYFKSVLKSVFKLIGKDIRKVLDSVEIREKIKAVVVDEAHLIAEW